MRRLFLFLTLSGAIITTNAQQNIVFSGTADPKFDGEYVFIYNNALKEGKDSVKIVDGKFTISRPFKEASGYYFFSGYQYRKDHGYSPFVVLVEKPSTIHLATDMADFHNTVITGSDAQHIYDDYANKTGSLDEAMFKTLYDKYGKDYVESNNVDTTTDKYKSLIKDYTVMSKQNNDTREQLAIGIIEAHPESFASDYLLARISTDLTLDELERLYGTLNAAYLMTHVAQNVAENISGRKKSAVGSMVDDFSLNDPSDRPMKFSSLKGHYVLIDFWGSWCRPCHQAFPRLKALYSKYHSKGFEILGLATETDTKAWKKDIVKSDLPWLQVVDDNSHVSAKEFAITEYPTAVLVDPQGKIIARFSYNQEDLRDEKIAALYQ